MELQELLENCPNINITITAAELSNFATEIAKKVIDETKEKAREQLIPRKELLKKVSAATLWTWEKTEFLIPVRMGAKVFYKRSDLEAINFEL